MNNLKSDTNAVQASEHTPMMQHSQKRNVELDDVLKKEDADQEISNLVRKISHRSPVYHLARRALDAELPYSEDIKALLPIVSAPSDVRWKERVVAAWILSRVEIEPGQKTENAHIVRVLCDVLANKDRLSVRYIKRGFQYALRVLPLTFPMACFGTWSEIHRGGSSIPWWGILLFGGCWAAGSTAAGTLLFSPLLFPLSLAWDTKHANRVRAECAGTLGRLQQPGSISVLATAVHDPSRQVGKAAFESLCRVLPAIEASHYGQLDIHITTSLCRLLKHSNEQFVVQVLEALDKVGNGSAVPFVQQLAEHSQSPQVQEAAQRILPNLKQRHQQEQAPKILLRPASGVTEVQKEVLLRPTSDNE